MTRELPSLTGLRGDAAVAVVLYHYGLLPGGWLAVDVFFVLSGYVLAHVYRDGLHRGEFLWARLARTIPTHWAATLVVGAQVVWLRHAAPESVVANLLLVGLVNPPTWSLIVEWYCYGFFAALWPLWREDEARLVVSRLSEREPRLAVRWGLQRSVRRARVGLLLFRASPQLCEMWRLRLRRQRRGVGRATAVCAIGAIAGLAGIIASDGGAAFGYGQIMRGLGWFLAGVGLYRTGWRPPSIWPLDTRLARWLGDISYPLYLIHFAPMLALCGCEHPTSWSTAAVGIPASFALAVALHYAVEVPARRWLRSIRLRRTVYA